MKARADSGRTVFGRKWKVIIACSGIPLEVKTRGNHPHTVTFYEDGLHIRSWVTDEHLHYTENKDEGEGNEG